MQKTKEYLLQMGLPREDNHALAPTPKRFPGGAQYRIEIPTTEEPRALQATLA